ncbi:MAG: endo-1,3-alpha-glucanase family glycosylhydrolase [Planctomycetota bacterium]
MRRLSAGRSRVARVLRVLVLLFASSRSATAGDAEVRLRPDRPELSRPFAQAKLVIAHFMTAMIPVRDAETGWIDPARYDPYGLTAPLGGQSQVVPIPSLIYNDDNNVLPLQEAALLEMRTAKALGVDGFNFFYPLGPDERFRDRYDTVILAFFRAAREHELDFKLTLCFCNPSATDVSGAEKVRILARHLARIAGPTRDSPNWLRTPDGRLIIYTWVPDGIIDDLRGRHWEVRRRPELVHKVAEAYEAVARSAGVEAAFLYHLRFPGDARHIDAVLDFFPAVAGWCVNAEDEAAWGRVAGRCRERRRAFVQEAYPDYYTSKLYRKGKGYSLIYSVDEMLRLGREGVVRHAHVLDLSRNFRRRLELAVDLDAPIINLTTWNDYPEGHHIAPEINHNFGFSLLLRHYKAIWRRRPDGGPREVAIAFFKKYPHATRPRPHDINVQIRKRRAEPSAEDAIEVVTILDRPARLEVDGAPGVEVGAGLVETRFPMQPGPVRVRVTRDGRVVLGFTTPEWITCAPYRTDRITFSYSSEHDRIYRQLYGDAPVHVSMEYAEDARGVPSWRSGMRTLRE